MLPTNSSKDAEESGYKIIHPKKESLKENKEEPLKQVHNIGGKNVSDTKRDSMSYPKGYWTTALRQELEGKVARPDYTVWPRTTHKGLPIIKHAHRETLTVSFGEESGALGRAGFIKDEIINDKMGL